MKKKKTMEQEINEFLEYWSYREMSAFLRDIIPVCELYDVEEQDDWVADAVGDEEARTIRLIRTVYLISRIAEFHSSKLYGVKTKFKNLFYRMEKQGTVDVVE